MDHAGTPPQRMMQRSLGGAFGRSLVIALTAFFTLVDLFATQAILPSLTKHYGVSPAAMGLAVNASTLGMAVAGLAMAFVSHRIDRRLGHSAEPLPLGHPHQPARHRTQPRRLCRPARDARRVHGHRLQL